MNKYLVTGCAGFVGSHLAEALVARGHNVLGVDAFTDYYSRTLKERNLDRLRKTARFELVEADLVEADLSALLDEVHGVFHLAAQPGVRGSWGQTFEIYVRDNLVATQRLFEAAAARRLRVVYASSSSIYGNAKSYPTPEDSVCAPISPYGVTKLGCEHLAGAYSESFGLDAVAVRYFTVYGPRQRPDMAFTRIMNALIDGASFEIFGSGDQSRDVTYVGDAVAATILALERGNSGAAYNVGGGTEASLNEVIRLTERLSGRKLATRFVDAAAGDVRRTVADTTKIRSEVGWTPQTPLEDGVASHLEWALTVDEPR